MSEVKRWTHHVTWNGELTIQATMMALKHDGEYVLASDYDQLKAERDRLKEAFKKMRNVAAGYSNYCEQDSASVRRLEKEFDAADDLYLSICALSTVSDRAGEGK